MASNCFRFWPVLDLALHFRKSGVLGLNDVFKGWTLGRLDGLGFLVVFEGLRQNPPFSLYLHAQWPAMQGSTQLAAHKNDVCRSIKFSSGPDVISSSNLNTRFAWPEQGISLEWLVLRACMHELARSRKRNMLASPQQTESILVDRHPHVIHSQIRRR